MKPPGADLAARRPVWQALSALYLDTDVREHYAEAARVCAASPYSLAQLQAILLDEVNPVLHSNVWQAAGVWQAFCQDWLCTEILRRQRQPRWWRRLAGREVPRHHWPCVAALIGQQRMATPSLFPSA